MTICKLCLRERRLKKSHYIPKGIYRIVGQMPIGSKESPVIVDPQRGVSVASDRQMTCKLLCDECEQLFSSNGENYVIRNLRNTNEFALLDDVMNGDDVLRSTDLDRKCNIDCCKYLYFTLSIFWRGSVTRWSNESTSIFNNLGPYQEKIRGWLRAEIDFPSNIYVEVLVDKGPISPDLHFPHKTKPGFYGATNSYIFLACGAIFRMHVGGRLNEIGREGLTGGRFPLALMKASFDEMGLNRYAERDIRSSRPVGKLQREHKFRKSNDA